MKKEDLPCWVRDGAMALQTRSLSGEVAATKSG